MTEQVRKSPKTWVIVLGAVVLTAVLAMGIFIHWGLAAFFLLAGGAFWGILMAFKSRDTLIRVVAFIFGTLCLVWMIAIPFLLHQPYP